MENKRKSKKAMFNWRCEPEDRRKLKQIAADRDVPMSEILREAFEMYYKQLDLQKRYGKKE